MNYVISEQRYGVTWMLVKDSLYPMVDGNPEEYIRDSFLPEQIEWSKLPGNYFIGLKTINLTGTLFEFEVIDKQTLDSLSVRMVSDLRLEEAILYIRSIFNSSEFLKSFSEKKSTFDP